METPSAENFRPYIPSAQRLPELSIRAVIIGILCALVFGVGNVYCGLKIGMTVTAAISSVVVALALIKGVFKGSILECTIIQSLGSCGDALLNGVIFTVPALMLMNLSREWGTIFLYAGLGSLIGGLLGIFFMIPLRRFLIVSEHYNLPFPEGTACAKILVAGDSGGAQAKPVLLGFAAGALVKILSQWLTLWKTDMFWSIKSLYKASFGFDATPVMLGVGYIIGLRITLIMFAGGLIGWFIGIPFLHLIEGTYLGGVIGIPKAIGTMDAETIGKDFIRYIGAGAMTVGGIIGAFKVIPMVVKSILPALKGLKIKSKPLPEESERTNRNLPLFWVLLFPFILLLILLFIPAYHMSVIGILLSLVFTFLFVAVSARMVGMIGTSSQPVSGMTIAALMIITLVLLAAGFKGDTGKYQALIIGVIICVAICTSGNISQDLKTGYYMGNTPAKQQLAEIFGTVFSAVIAGFVLILFQKVWGFGTKELMAPQATIISTIINGVMGGGLPWGLLIFGGLIALLLEIYNGVVGAIKAEWQVSTLALAIGLYLPISTSTSLIIGGGVSYLVLKARPGKTPDESGNERGTLFASGLIAGDAIMSVFYALIVLVGLSAKISLRDLSAVQVPWIDPLIALGVFIALAIGIYGMALKKAEPSE